MPAEKKVKVLFLAANPHSHLNINTEIRDIQAKIRTSEFRDAVELIPCLAVRPGDLIGDLARFKPHIVHFSGHGNQVNEIYLEDDSGKARPVSEKALRELFRVMKDNIRLVVLNACFSGSQAKVIARTIETTIGMSTAVGDKAAICFDTAFYRAVGFGRSVQRAFDEARLELMLQGIPEEDTPQLFNRDDAVADRLFLLHDSSEPKTATQPSQKSSQEIAALFFGVTFP